VISNLEVIGEASHNIKVRFPEFAASHQELPLAFGFVEPVQPPLPMHIFAQQVMGLAPQENGVTASDWATWLGRAPKLCGLDTAQFTVLIQYMGDTEILHTPHSQRGFFRLDQTTKSKGPGIKFPGPLSMCLPVFPCGLNDRRSTRRVRVYCATGAGGAIGAVSGAASGATGA